MAAGRSLILIDGEHYPPVIARAISSLKGQGVNPVLALMVGGREKLGQIAVDIGLPVVQASWDAESALAGAIDRVDPDEVIDLSDDPVLGYEMRTRLASVALWKGVVYRGADFEFSPPPRPRLAQVPSMGVIGTGKRSGKTAVGGALARTLRDAGRNPVVVAMGRGGPAEPEVLGTNAQLDPEALLRLSSDGRHAASDYIEDAMTAGVPTVGAWRAGGGLAGATRFHNYEAALEAAAALEPAMVIMEGSGSALPPAHFDAGIFVVDARIDPAFLRGYFGLYRVLLADLVVLTMCEDNLDSGHLAEVEKSILRSTLKKPRLIRTVFRPFPLQEELAGRSVWFATTASVQAADLLKSHLEERHGVKVVTTIHSLSDRPLLQKELENAPPADVLLVELKAAAVDVASKFALEREMKVVYVDNRPEPSGPGDLEELFLDAAEKAAGRHARGIAT